MIFFKYIQLKGEFEYISFITYISLVIAFILSLKNVKMWFVLKNIKSSSIFNVYIIYFIIIVTPNNTSSNPVSTVNQSPNLEIEKNSMDTTNNLNNNYDSQSEVSTTNDASKSSNKFPLGSMSSILQTISKFLSNAFILS